MIQLLLFLTCGIILVTVGILAVLTIYRKLKSEDVNKK